MNIWLKPIEKMKLMVALRNIINLCIVNYLELVEYIDESY